MIRSSTLSILLSCVLPWLLGITSGGAQSPAQAQTTPTQYYEAATAAFQKGNHKEAIQGFYAASKGFSDAKDFVSQANAMGNLAIAMHATGNYRLAFTTLDQALNLARDLKDEDLISQLRGIAGSISTFSRRAGDAQRMLEFSITQTRKTDDSDALALLLHDYGVMWAGRGRTEEATKAFDETLELCEKQQLTDLKVKTLANRAMMYLNLALEQFDLMEIRGEEDFYYTRYLDAYETHLQNCLDSVMTAQKSLGSVSGTYDKSIIATTLGDCYRTMLEKKAANSSKSAEEALAMYQLAIKSAKEAGNPLALSYALGAMGRLYEERQRYPEALALTREARRLAQELSTPDILFEWSWQSGRILKAVNQIEEAKKAYEAAKQTLDPIRHDLAIGYGNRNLGRSFREAVGAFYFELAEIYLDESRQTTESNQEILKNARGIVESLKSAELEDYFQDDCVNIALGKRKDIDETLKDDPRTAIIYTIPLVQGTATLVTIGDRIHFARSEISGRDLQREALRMRDFIVRPEASYYDYQGPAQKLYDAIIRPIKPLLDKNAIETLVFVPDGALRTVPMSALHDGEKHLIEDYAVAITPGLTLMDPKEIPTGNAEVLVGALSEARHGFSALPYVEREVEKITTQSQSAAFKDGNILHNERFLKGQLQNSVKEGTFTIVHIASHGEFQRESGNSFFLTWDGKLTLDELEAMIRPKEFDENPVEMLCLSACKTALGDDRAALGLAGIAVKSGARSALATLWEVDDEVTSNLMAQFYNELLQGKSRVEALRTAQLAVLQSEQPYDFPFFWAPFMIIGNWY
tara:strand:- start:22590 stop:25016 length:2427 start_codon:yes stop_codon:yes gene_type:complete